MTKEERVYRRKIESLLPYVYIVIHLDGKKMEMKQRKERKRVKAEECLNILLHNKSISDLKM